MVTRGMANASEGRSLHVQLLDAMACKLLHTLFIRESFTHGLSCHFSQPGCHGSPEANLDRVWQKMVAFWKLHPCPDHFLHMKLSMFVSLEDPHDKFPCLSGRAIETKNLLPALASVWKEYAERGNPAHDTVGWGLAQSIAMDQILDRYPDVDKLPDAEGIAYRDAAYNYARAQSACASHFNRQHGGSLMIFDITAKTHWMLHGADNALFLNPRLSWNYSGEDFMGKTKVLQASCCRGNSAGHSCNKFAEKYGCALHFTFKELGL